MFLGFLVFLNIADFSNYHLYYHGERNKKLTSLHTFGLLGKWYATDRQTDIPACAVISVCPERLSNSARIYNTILVTGTKWFGLVMTLRQHFMNPCSEGVILQTVNRIGVLAT